MTTTNKAGTRVTCKRCGAQVVVTKPGDGDVRCCPNGESLTELQVGKRYACASCGGEVLVTKATAQARLECCRAEMARVQLKKTRSAD